MGMRLARPSSTHLHPAPPLPGNVSRRYGAAFGTKLNWGLSTVEQPGAGGRHIRCTRGRGEGGTSLLNGMLYNRGSRETFAEWHRAATRTGPETGTGPGTDTGAGGNAAVDSAKAQAKEIDWSVEACVERFRRHELNSRGGSLQHGGAGEVAVSDLPGGEGTSPIARAFVEAAQQAGHRLNPDQNDLSPGSSQVPNLCPRGNPSQYRCILVLSCFDGDRFAQRFARLMWPGLPAIALTACCANMLTR